MWCLRLHSWLAAEIIWSWLRIRNILNNKLHLTTDALTSSFVVLTVSNIQSSVKCEWCLTMETHHVWQTLSWTITCWWHAVRPFYCGCLLDISFWITQISHPERRYASRNVAVKILWRHSRIILANWCSNRLTATAPHVSSQFCLPPDRGYIPASTPGKAVARFIDLEGW